MAQFDVYRNKGTLRESIPFVVVVQSAQFDRYQTRGRHAGAANPAPTKHPHRGSQGEPNFVIEGVRCVLHPLDMVLVADDQRGEVVGSLAQEGQIIADALDELLTRSWG